MAAYIQLLRHNPDFARLWLAQVISLLGDWFGTIVLSALVAEYTNASGLAVSVFLLARFVPSLIVSPFAGVLVDKFNRKRLLILSDLLRTVVVMLFLVVVAGGPSMLWLLYLLTILQFAISAVFDPGRNAIMPGLLRREDLVLANTLGSVTWSAMLAVGAIFGGVIAALFGTNVAIIIDALTFAASAIIIWNIQTGAPAKPATQQTERDLTDRGFVEGLRFIRKHPDIAATLMVKLGQSLGNVDALMIVYASSLFVMGENRTDSTTPLSIMYAAFGIGAVVGPLILNRYNDGSIRVMRRLIIIGYIWISVGWLLFGSASTLLFVSLALVLRAMGGSANWTYSSVIIQKSTPDEFLGRMFSLDMAGFQFASVLSTIATGVLIDSMGVEHARDIVTVMFTISLIPLTLWFMAKLYLDRHEALALAVSD